VTAQRSAGQLVSGLVHRGLYGLRVEGLVAGDGRGVLVGLTSAGIEAAQHQARAREAKFAAILGRVPKAQRGKVITALELLAEAADAPT
jgi:hypothetical protein